MISLITPIYNGRQYVEKGLKCLLSQTYRDIEIIVIDDGSTDGTSELIDEIATTDDRIKVLHKQNEGVGKARNDGLRMATGEYIYFFDIDDEVEANMLETMTSAIDSTQADLLVFGFNVCWNNHKDVVTFKDLYLKGREHIAQHYTKDMLMVPHGNGFLWNKLYKRSVIENNQICFNTFRVQEDELFNIEYMKHVESILLSKNVFYTYYLANAGNSRSRYIPNYLQIIQTVYGSFKDLGKSYLINDVDFENYYHQRAFNAVMQWCRCYLFHPDNKMTKKEKKKVLQALNTSDFWKQVSHHPSTSCRSQENKIYANGINATNINIMWLNTELYSFIRNLLSIIRHA